VSDLVETNRWRGVLALTLGAGALGLAANRADLLVVATVGVVYAAFPRVTSAPTASVDVDRRLSDRAPSAGDVVEVTVTVTNTGSSPLTDVRVVDGVPGALTVTDGSPRHGTSLLPGGSDTFTYTVRATAGRHRFEPATVVVRDSSGAVERTTTVTTETEIDCSTDSAESPLRSQTIDAVGQIPANVGGNGVEFHSTRDYHRSDSMRRVDWKRYAKTGELSTVDFREERAATVVVLVDARERAYRGVDDDPHAVDAAVAAAEQLFVAALERRNRVGIAGFGRETCWFAPGAGRNHRARGREFLATHPTFRSDPPSTEPPLEEQTLALRNRLPSDAQLLVLTPLCDDEVTETVRKFESEGHAVSVLTPDVTMLDSPGRRLASVERATRIRRLRQSNVPVVEWDPNRPLAATLDAVAGESA
jgi:uncharacterized repeat protein (TIGR01451 family)